jgi:hypothetical protein
MSDEYSPEEWTGVSSKVAVLPSAIGEMVAVRDVGPPHMT